MSSGTGEPGDPPWVDLDAVSSRPLHPAAREAWLAAMEKGYADPRRLHHAGRSARMILDNARAVVAEALDVRPDEVTFTGSGTEAVRLGLLGLAQRTGAGGLPVVHTAVEHSSVLHAARETGRAQTVPVDEFGRVVVESVPQQAAVVACQSANHEVGTAQPVELVAARTSAPVFMDACVSAGVAPLPSGWDVAALSAHKWGGPPGVGVLLIRHRSAWRNPRPEDDRTDHRASGFENVPGALAAAAALQAVVAERDEVARRHHALIDHVRSEVARIPDTEVVGDPKARLPGLVTFSHLYVDGEALVTELDRHGFGIASGSACAASALEPSHVLAAMGALTHGNVRLSLQRESTRDDIDRFLAVLPGVVAELRARVGL